VSPISVITPVRDGERYLADALESVLAGSRIPDEVIVVDDGSSDSSAAVAAGFGDAVRVIRQDPAGQAAAVNRGIRESHGELIAFIDADDLWEPAKLELQEAHLAEHPEHEAVFGHVEEFLTADRDEADGPPPQVRAGAHPARLRGTMLARRSLLDRVGPSAEHLRAAEYIDWYARAQELGVRDAMLPDVVLRRRLHAENLGRRNPGSPDYARVVRAALHRRREASA
jgi:glycosyltransferase involved in cell wall biosynthesis